MKKSDKKIIATNRKAYHDYFIEETHEAGMVLTGSEINRLQGKVQEKGYTIVPLRLYLRNNRAKVEIALVRGKKLYDKRRAIAKRDADREMQRAVKDWRRSG
jgi:SsrA-binding protein